MTFVKGTSGNPAGNGAQLGRNRLLRKVGNTCPHCGKTLLSQDPFDQLYEALGGVDTICEWLGISRQAVYMWKGRKTVPAHLHLRVLSEARRLGVTVDEVVFGKPGLLREDLELLGLDDVVRWREESLVVALRKGGE